MDSVMLSISISITSGWNSTNAAQTGKTKPFLLFLFGTGNEAEIYISPTRPALRLAF